MSQRRYYLVVLLLCACGAANVLFYVITDGDVTQTAESYASLRYPGHHIITNHSWRFGDTRTDEDVFQRSNGGHSVRKLNNAEAAADVAKPSAFTADGLATSVAASASQYGEDDTRLYEFAINNVELCGDAEDHNSSVVIVVTSRIGNFLRRNAIRNTWGSVVKDLEGTILFLIGIDSNEMHQHQVEKESELYGDIVQVNIWDTYANLTYKSIAMLQWLADYCSNSKFYVKADDDVYINVGNVIKESRTINHADFFLCHVFKNAPVVRDPNSKWFVSRDHYAKNRFPTYCSGSAYVFSSSILNKLYISTLKARFCILEDVFITGIAAQEKNIAHVHNGEIAFYRRNATGCEYAHALSGHQVTITQMYVIFAQLANHDIDCKKSKHM